jgi:hypothetical protein
VLVSPSLKKTLKHQTRTTLKERVAARGTSAMLSGETQLVSGTGKA